MQIETRLKRKSVLLLNVNTTQPGFNRLEFTTAKAGILQIKTKSNKTHRIKINKIFGLICRKERHINYTFRSQHIVPTDSQPGLLPGWSIIHIMVKIMTFPLCQS